MFHNISPAMRQRMTWLEAEDRRDRSDATPRMQRLRQIPPETGRFIAILAAGAPPGDIIEIGASAGYSGLWLALACMELNRVLTTFEVLADKIPLAQETFHLAGVEKHVSLVHGDARRLLPRHDRVAFCFLDAEKEHYAELYELIVPRLVPGGLLVADNVISHRETLGALVDRAARDHRVDSVVIPVGKGELVCRKIS